MLAAPAETRKLPPRSMPEHKEGQLAARMPALKRAKYYGLSRSVLRKRPYGSDASREIKICMLRKNKTICYSIRSFDFSLTRTACALILGRGTGISYGDTVCSLWKRRAVWAQYQACPLRLVGAARAEDPAHL